MIQDSVNLCQLNCCLARHYGARHAQKEQIMAKKIPVPQASVREEAAKPPGLEIDAIVDATLGRLIRLTLAAASLIRWRSALA